MTDAEVERATAERNAAYEAGARDMRERAARACEINALRHCSCSGERACYEVIRALPLRSEP